MADAQAWFPIRHVAEVTGVLPVTLRAWERRYGLLKPQRTPKGHRLYSAADIARVQQVLALLRQGLSIGQVRPVLDSRGGEPVGDDHDALRRRLHDAARAADFLALTQLIFDAGKTYPLPVLAERVLRPLVHALAQSPEALDRAALSVLHDAMQAALLRRVSLWSGRAGTRPLLFAAMPGDDGLSYRLAWALAVESGLAVQAVGARLPLDYLGEVAEETGATAIVVWADQEPVAGWEGQLRRLHALCRQPLYLGGELAGRHAAMLAEIGVAALPPDAELALAQLGADRPRARQ